ncbi:MAG: cryptochrome/photolyase family protein [Rickettsiales bacterium]
MAKALVWLRQDLRLADNAALTYALNNYRQVVVLYIYDEQFQLGKASKWWLGKSLAALRGDINLTIRIGDATKIISEIVEKENINGLFWNRCYDAASIARDKKVKEIFKNIECKSFNSALLFEPWEIQTGAKTPFSVFTPYWRACLALGVTKKPLPMPNVAQVIPLKSDTFTYDPNWADSFTWQAGEKAAHKRLQSFIKNALSHYDQGRNIPSEEYTSKLSPHLHFGEISPVQIWYELVRLKNTERFLTEIGWREFSYHLLYHHPHLPSQNFRKSFDNFTWTTDPQGFAAWKQGLTGYPIVDAGMRQLWQTGYMHNRVRMIAASFLVKDLHIDWREGAAWFLDTLVDADLASNSASWQWVAGSGADAAPFFRIFNPVLQGEKFDPNGDYIRKYVPELAAVPDKYIHKPWLTHGVNYPKPIVDHNTRRLLALKKYKNCITAPPKP